MPSLYIVISRQTPGVDLQVNGRSLSTHAEFLGNVARDLSVKPLMAFFSIDPEEAAAFIDDAGGDSSSMTIEDEEWFDPKLGLATVGALSSYISERASAIEDADGILGDLNEFERVLRQADVHGLGWHVAVDY